MFHPCVPPICSPRWRFSSALVAFCQATSPGSGWPPGAASKPPASGCPATRGVDGGLAEGVHRLLGILSGTSPSNGDFMVIQ